MSLRKSKFLPQTEFQKEYSAKEELFDSEEGLVRYNKDLVRKFSRGLGVSHNSGGGEEVLEFGAGTGALAEVWRVEFGYDPICIEIDPELIDTLQSKGFETFQGIGDIPSKISYIYTSNVLEHILDDVEALKAIRKKMTRGGKIAIYVPALPVLFSDLDRRAGHFRRYKKRELENRVRLAGFEIEKCFYNDCVGVLASMTLRFVGYKNSAGLGGKRSLLIYDKYIYPVSKVLDSLFMKHLIGKNLFLFAVNPK